MDKLLLPLLTASLVPSLVLLITRSLGYTASWLEYFLGVLSLVH